MIDTDITASCVAVMIICMMYTEVGLNNSNV